MSATLKVVASGSHGNCYILTAGADKLILEAGVSDKTLLNALNYDLSGVCGVIVSHSHSDHAKYIPKFSRYFTVYGNSVLKECYPTIQMLKPKKRYKIGNFEVMPLEVEHSVPNFAYVIDHDECGRMVFATDCVSFPYIIKDVVSAVIECNYVDEAVLRNALDGDESRSQYGQHMELTQSIEAVEQLGNPLFRNVILCHLSSANSDRKIMTERFEKELDITPQYAVKGTEFDVSQFEF